VHGYKRRLQQAVLTRRNALRARRRQSAPPRVEGLQLLRHCRISALLHRHVDRREDTQTGLVDALPTKPLQEFAANLLLEVLAARLFGAKPVSQHDALVAVRLPGVPFDDAAVEHHLEDDISPGL